MYIKDQLKENNIIIKKDDNKSNFTELYVISNIKGKQIGNLLDLISSRYANDFSEIKTDIMLLRKELKLTKEKHKKEIEILNYKLKMLEAGIN